MSIETMRQEYSYGSLDESDAPAEPFALFARWFGDAAAASVPEPNAMTLATSTSNGAPSARVVLLKAFDARGFAFFTNYDSRKGGDLESNPCAALVFFWPTLERQVRVEGRVERVDESESDTYFQMRPRSARLGAWASRQSSVLPSRGALEQRMRVLDAEYPGETPIPRPPYWGGFRVVPRAVEFWQGRSSRLHDRLLYRRLDANWTLVRLAP